MSFVCTSECTADRPAQLEGAISDLALSQGTSHHESDLSLLCILSVCRTVSGEFRMQLGALLG